MEDVKLKKKKLMGIPGHIKPDLPQIKTQKIQKEQEKGDGEGGGKRWKTMRRTGSCDKVV